MKPIMVGNLDVEVKMNDAGVADVNAGMKMKHTEHKMKPIKVGNLDVEVKMNDAGVEMKSLKQNLLDGFCFDCD